MNNENHERPATPQTPPSAGPQEQRPGHLPPGPPRHGDGAGIWQTFYGVLFRPGETFRHDPRARALGPAAIAIALSSLIGGLSFNTPGAGGLLLALLTVLGWNLIIWLVCGAALFVVARAMRHQGEFGELMGATGVAFLPTVMVGPLSAVMGWGMPGALIGGVGMLALLLWFVWVYLASVSGVTGLSTRGAVAAVVVSQLALVAIPVIGLALAFMGLAVAIASAG